MGIKIVELFGFDVSDKSDAANEARESMSCPFVGGQCTKTLGRDRDRVISGVCTVRQARSGPVIICPNRLYSDGYRVLADIASEAFGEGIRLVRPGDFGKARHDGREVVVFGKRWGKELHLPSRGKHGAYFVDWILAHIDSGGSLKSFVAVEVQSMDTTGNYRAEREALLSGEPYPGDSPGGINWENVSKRILPQLIYKGNVLRRERLCECGLFFVCPAPVFMAVNRRLGGGMIEYTKLQPGSLTFRWYDIAPAAEYGMPRQLEFKGEFRTTVDQVAVAFTAPVKLPPENVYEQAIRAELYGS